MKIVELLKTKLKKYDDTHNFTCDVCGREVFANERICKICFPLLPWNRVVCPFCGRKVGEEGVCLDCKERRIAVDLARSLFVHEGEAARLVVRFKRGEKYLFRTFAEYLAPCLEKNFPDADAVTFVPMTERAEKERGYNQSRLLAEAVAERSGRTFLAPAVKRRETAAQKFLSRAEREENLKGCFRVEDKKSVAGRRIVIIDDTLTTGATAGELCAVLRKAKAEKVYLLTITSVPKKHPFGIPDAEAEE